MNRYPPTAVAVDGSAFLFGDRFEAFGVRNGFLVTEDDNPDWTDDFQDASLFDAVIHKEGRWFVGSLYTVALTDEAGGKRNHLCAIAPLTEIGSGAAMKWFYEHVGCIPERAREAFAKGQALDAGAPTSTDDAPEATPSPESPAKRAKRGGGRSRHKDGPDDRRLFEAWKMEERADLYDLAKRFRMTHEQAAKIIKRLGARESRAKTHKPRQARS